MKVKDITARDIWIARSRIAPYVTKTPLVYSHTLSEMTGANIYLKLENLQEIGAFKVRGAANKILSLPEESRKAGVSTFSTGNHGAAVAYISSKLGIPAIVCMSRHVPEVKVKNIARWGAKILQNWDSQDDAGVYCSEMEREQGHHRGPAPSMTRRSSAGRPPWPWRSWRIFPRWIRSLSPSPAADSSPV